MDGINNLVLKVLLLFKLIHIMDDHKLQPFNRSQKTNALDVLLSCTRFSSFNSLVGIVSDQNREEENRTGRKEELYGNRADGSQGFNSL